jgi:hypothetical protein
MHGFLTGSIAIVGKFFEEDLKARKIHLTNKMFDLLEIKARQNVKGKQNIYYERKVIVIGKRKRSPNS